MTSGFSRSTLLNGVSWWNSAECFSFSDTDWMIRGSNPDRGYGLFSHHHVQTGSEAHPASYAMDNRDPFRGGYSSPGVKLTTHLPLVPRSRIRGAIPSLPQYAFMGWCSVKKAQGQLHL
jgi:hypothetical protein